MDYRTVDICTFSELEERRSRFIGYIKPVTTQEEALEFISSIKKKHFDARHNVYAYRLKSGAEKFSDDGEPGGTAGAPVMNILKNEELLDVCVVVTRYFGGILLGAGGLVRAYSKACRDAVAASGIITMECVKTAEVKCDYNNYARLLKLAEQYDADLYDTQFTDDVSAYIKINDCNIKGFSDALKEISCGKATINITGEDYRKKREGI